MNKYRVGDIGFTVMTLDEAGQWVLDASRAPSRVATEGRPGVAVHFCNAYNVALAKDDPEYAALLTHANAVFSDGVPITWVGKRAYPEQADAWERVYGPDVMRLVLSQSDEFGPRHYLLGSTPETLALLEQQLRRDYPDALVVGRESPPFRPASDAELAERDQRIADSGATIVWVGLGTPKQDFEVQRLAASLPVVAMAVGAAFDFLAGTKAQAPVWVQKSGLEWAFRLASEPRRLGKRYVWGNSVFTVVALKTLRSTRHAR